MAVVVVLLELPAANQIASFEILNFRRRTKLIFSLWYLPYLPSLESPFIEGLRS